MNIKELKTLFVAVALGTLMFPSALDAATWYVAKDGHDTSSGSVDAPFATIQKAVDAASSNDVIRVGDGAYAAINSNNRCIRIISVNGPAKTTIAGACLTDKRTLPDDPYHYGDTGCRSTVLEGFTITTDGNGRGVEGGTVCNCVITNCAAAFGGGMLNSSLRNCVVSGCRATSTVPWDGFGGAAFGGDMVNCLIEGNRAANLGGAAVNTCMRNCTVVGNVVENSMQGGSGGVDYEEMYANPEYELTVKDSIIWGNLAVTEGSSVCMSNWVDYDSPYAPRRMADMENVCTWPMPLKGTICCTNDPCFFNPEQGDYRLRPGSPCIDKGQTNSVWATDLRGAPRIVNGFMDLGAYEWQVGEGVPLGIIEKPHDVVYVYDGAAKTACPPAETLSISGVNVASDVGVYVVMVSPVNGLRWSDGTTDAVGVSMTILPRQVTLTSADAMWTYDGQWHNAPEVAVGGDGFVAGEGFETTNMTYVCDVGQCRNEFYYWLKEGTQESNYNVTVRYGTLTVLPQETPPVNPDGGPYTEQVGGYTWSFFVTNGMAVIRGRESFSLLGYDAAITPEPTGDVVIPSALGGCPVVGIGEGALALCSMTSVVVPEGVTFISSRAFSGCTIAELTIPGSVRKLDGDIFWMGAEVGFVHFEGDAPDADGLYEAVMKLEGDEYESASDYLITYVNRGTHGWNPAGGDELPDLWNGCRIAYWGESPILTHTVTFDLGEHGSPTGGVALVQTVTNGCAAVEPIVIPHEGWRFEGWDKDFSCVTNDLTVIALYSESSLVSPETDFEELASSVSWDATIVFAPGEYDLSLLDAFFNRGFSGHLIAAEGPAATILSGKTQSEILPWTSEGFTFTHAGRMSCGTFVNCVFRDCSGLCFDDSTLTGCTVVGNRDLSMSLCLIAQSTFTGNRWSQCIMSATFVNSIVWEEDTRAFMYGWEDSATAFLFHMNVFNHCCLNVEVPDGEGNICADPQFFAPSIGDVRLRKGSPCIDAGSNDHVSVDTDIGGRPRVVGNAVDIGAYEWQVGEESTPAGIVEKPQDVVYVYDGVDKTACPPTETLSISGENVASNVGVYVVMVSLANGLCWSDGTTEAVSVAMTILPRPVTLTSADATWTYDGQWHNVPEVTVGGDGFVPGEGFETTNMTYVCNVGEYQNEFYYWPKEGTLESNYDITIRYGTLTVLPQETPPVNPDGFYAEIVDGLTWTAEILDGEATIRGCEGVLPANLVIPSAIGGCPVVALGESLFDADFRDDVHGIVSVMIPASVRHLEDYVFWYCTGLKYVNYEGNWDELEFDDEDGVFEGTPYKNGWGVPFLVIEDDVVVGVDWRLERSDCGCVTNGVLRIPDGVVGIAACALSFIEEFESVEIPAGVKTVGEYAFAWNRGLTSVRIADGGTLVSSTAFNGTGWKLANGGWRVPFVENDGGTLKVTYRSVNEDCTCAVSENGSLVIPDGVSVIPAGAFAEECDKMIVSIFCPTSLATVGSAAFAGCRPYLEKLALTAHGIGVACDAFGTDSEFVARVGISLNEGDLAIEGWQVGETVYPATGNEAFLSGVAGGVARPVVKQMEFGVGQASSFAMPTSMGGGRAMLAGVSGLDWSHFNLCEYKGPGSLPDQWCYTRADIVDVEKTEANDEDDYECYSLSALDIAYWGGWIPKDDYPAVDDVADEFRSDGFWWPYDWVEEQGFGYENSIYDSVEYPEGNGLYGINEFITRNLRSGKSLIQLGTWDSGHGMVCCGYVCDESRDLADAGYLKGLFIVDSDNDMRNNGGGRDAPNCITYCPIVWDWQNGAYFIANIWGLPWDGFSIDHSLWARGVEMIPYEEPVFGFECDGTVVRGYHGELPLEIEIPNGATGIGEYAFAWCANVETLVLPRSIEQIGYRAFYNCPNLRTIYVAEGDADRIRSLLEMSGLDMNGVSIRLAKPENGVWHYVEFDIGEMGDRVGGGDNEQIVSNRCSAVAPEVSAAFGWRFVGWSCDFDCVTNDLHVEARYCCNVSLMPTNAVEGIAYSGQLRFDGDETVTWASATDAYLIEAESSTFVAGMGAPLGLTDDDQACAYDLPFAFSFYGVDYTRVYPSSNGTIFFDAPNNQWSYNAALFRSHPMIAVQWRDMCNGDVYVDVAADAVTFTWRSQYNAGGTANCSVKLFRDGTIHCAYGNGNAAGGYVGISSGDGERFALIASEGVSRANADDVIISPAGLPRWLTLTENGGLSGTPGEQGVFDFNVIALDRVGHAAVVPVSITVIENPNRRPIIARKSPEGDSVVATGGSNVVYSVVASDPDGSALTYEWRVDGEVVAGATTGVFVAYFDIGERHDVECLVSDGFWTTTAGKWRSITSREWFVDAINGSDENDGQSREKAFRSIYRAVDSASDDDIITVLPGDYGESIWDCRKRLLVRGVAGADRTVLHGNFYAAYELPDAIAALRFQGVTLCDGQVVRATLENCVIRDMPYGCGELFLRRCYVWNVSDLSCYLLTAEHCTFVGNFINYGERLVGLDCLIFGNTYSGQPLPDTFADPRLVDASNRDLRLRVGSPAIGAASDGTNLGAYQGDPVSGHVVSCTVDGHGALEQRTFVVADNGGVTVRVSESDRPTTIPCP